MYKLENKTILIISNEPWGEIWYSKHNWAFELSKKNKVFFINAPKSWVFSDLFKRAIHADSITENLVSIRYNNRLPFTRFEMINNLNEAIITKTLKKWLAKQGIHHTVFWSFDPYRFPNPKALNAEKSIFFRVDKFLLLKRERALLKNVDGLIVTAEILLKGTQAKKHLVLSHGISEDEFKPTADIKYDAGYLIYVGNIDYRMDVNLLKELLIAFPKKQFLFIGKLVDTPSEVFHDIFFKNNYPNLILHGVEHFKNLKNYINKAQACLAPMDISIDGNEIHHHKSLQYLALGKPIISPVFNDSINNNEMILGYTSINEAKEKIKHLESTETQEKAQERITYAKKFLYSNLIKQVEHFLSE